MFSSYTLILCEGKFPPISNGRVGLLARVPYDYCAKSFQLGAVKFVALLNVKVVLRRT